MQSTNASKNLLVKCDGYVLRFEYNEDYVVIHLYEIDKFTKGVFQDLATQIENWTHFLKAMGHACLWAAVPRDDTKIKRLLGGLKFQFVSHADDLTVYKYEV